MAKKNIASLIKKDTKNVDNNPIVEPVKTIEKKIDKTPQVKSEISGDIAKEIADKVLLGIKQKFDDIEITHENKANSWLGEQVEVLTRENNELKQQLEMLSLNNNNINNDGNNELMVNILNLFDELQTTYIRINIEKQGQMLIHPEAFIPKLLNLFPFLNNYKKFNF